MDYAKLPSKPSLHTYITCTPSWLVLAAHEVSQLGRQGAKIFRSLVVFSFWGLIMAMIPIWGFPEIRDPFLAEKRDVDVGKHPYTSP